VNALEKSHKRQSMPSLPQLLKNHILSKWMSAPNLELKKDWFRASSSTMDSTEVSASIVR